MSQRFLVVIKSSLWKFNVPKPLPNICVIKMKTISSLCRNNNPTFSIFMTYKVTWRVPVVEMLILLKQMSSTALFWNRRNVYRLWQTPNDENTSLGHTAQVSKNNWKNCLSHSYHLWYYSSIKFKGDNSWSIWVTLRIKIQYIIFG